MPFNRPSLATLMRRMRSDLESRLSSADAQLRRSVESVLSRVVPGLTHGLHGHLAWIARQVMPDTAEAEHLARWAGVWGVERRAATHARGPVLLTGTNGQTSPSTSTWQRADGVLYRQLEAATISGGEATVTLEAEEAGSAGNASAGTRLTAVSPVLGVRAEAFVTGDGIVDGVDVEADPSLLARLLTRIQRAPKGGAPGDYERWALEVPGVTRAWERPGLMGLGTVGVFFVTDGPGGPIPSLQKVEEVQAHLDANAPVTAWPYALAPVGVPLDPHILLVPNTAEARAEVEAELADLLLREGAPGATIYRSWLAAAIDRAPTEISHELELPEANVTHASNEIPVLGTIEWVV